MKAAILGLEMNWEEWSFSKDFPTMTTQNSETVLNVLSNYTN